MSVKRPEIEEWSIVGSSSRTVLLAEYARELERRAKELCDEADDYAAIGFDHSNESAQLRAAVKSMRDLLEGK